LSVTAGLRWTRDEKTFLPDQFVVNAGWLNFLVNDGDLLLPQTPAKIGDEAWTPMATLSYRWAPELMTYVSYSEGFKGGGFTQRVFPPLPVAPSFRPERVATYEFGFKSDLADGRVRLNGAVFRNKYSDLQVSVNDPNLGFAPILQNAGEAEINGFELEFLARPIPALRIEAGVGYLDAKYTQVGIPGFGTGVTIDSSLQNAPEWTLSAGVSYDIDLGKAGTLSPRIDWAYRSEVFNDAENTPEIVQPGYHLLNATIVYNDVDSLWSVRLGVKNITETVYLVSGYRDAFGGLIEGNFGRPREWFLSVKRAF
jgi:iron complex outermembrane receptor protein